ncbi:hypothetical protein H6G97_39140 [Nostoc flagelliforme FACHB-838]|uniref:Transposase n=1 Tax=Nostoc flagelliforme FACHB-838 TaxID=2692904 RepID=A0ABR8E3B5_9NOSO|nr:hypothetical protein [Nostoc flagelliforme FACHB-838]
MNPLLRWFSIKQITSIGAQYVYCAKYVLKVPKASNLTIDVGSGTIMLAERLIDNSLSSEPNFQNLIQVAVRKKCISPSGNGTKKSGNAYQLSSL